MSAQAIGTGLVVAAVCAVIGFIALMRQAGRHCDDRADLLRGQLDAYRAGQASVLVQVLDDDPEWWDRQFDGITSELGSDGGDAP